ncbi:MAG: TetR/AcrR family transcriptional regulator [Gemmatimonadetes bacterium]|nr:TetR/AcrR family transcriptional regulator [Gemmatimonadota bacterium]
MPNPLHDNAKPKSGYHHGDLRAELIREGIRQLERGGVAELSLRQLAKSVGVTGSAPYRHFPDRSALLEAIAAEGYRRVAATLAPSGVRVAEGARRVVHFAAEHPAWWELMAGGGGAIGPDLEEARGSFLAELVGVVERSIGGESAEEAIRLAVAVWAALLGLVRLRASGGVAVLDEAMVPEPAALAESIVTGRPMPPAGARPR